MMPTCGNCKYVCSQQSETKKKYRNGRIVCCGTCVFGISYRQTSIREKCRKCHKYSNWTTKEGWTICPSFFLLI